MESVNFNHITKIDIFVKRSKVDLLGIEKIKNICKLAIELEYINAIYDKEIADKIKLLDKLNGFSD